jgi:secondary thiamine-phosphate synthase enzyme
MYSKRTVDQMIYELEISTPAVGLINITQQVARVVGESGLGEGICQVFVPHTTAGITINENADPDVVADLLAGLAAMVPKLAYRHGEGNSPAHIQATLLGSSISVPIQGGSLYLGTWQGIYLGEFDGPRRRTVAVNLVGN